MDDKRKQRLLLAIVRAGTHLYTYMENRLYPEDIADVMVLPEAYRPNVGIIRIIFADTENMRYLRHVLHPYSEVGFREFCAARFDFADDNEIIRYKLLPIFVEDPPCCSRLGDHLKYLARRLLGIKARTLEELEIQMALAGKF